MSNLPSSDREISANRASRQQIVIVWIVALVLTVLSLTSHLTAGSTLHQDKEMWQYKVSVHQRVHAFQVRPLTTSIVVALHDHAGVPFRTGFMVLQFMLFLLCGPVFWYFLRILGFSPAYSLAGMIIYLLTLPLFLAHFEPVHTWSDFWVYLFVPLSFTMAMRRRYVVALITIVLALMARETTFLFLPVWFLFIYAGRDRRYTLAAGLTLLAAALFVGARLWFFGRITAPPEADFQFNFENYLRGSDTIFSLIVSLGFVWVVGLWQVFHRARLPIRFYNLIRFGAIFTAAGFVSSTILMARARETRLFVPPVIFLLPLILVYVQERAARIKSILRRLPAWTTALGGVALLALGIWAAKLAFPKFEYRLWPDGNWTYLGLHLALIALFLIVELSRLGAPVAD